MADEFKLDPNTLRVVKADLDSASSSVKILNSFFSDFISNLTKLKSSNGLSDIISQVNQITKALKDQAQNTNEAVLIENKKKILMNQILLTHKDITNESKKQILLENQKLEQQNNFLTLGFNIAQTSKLITKETEEQVKARGGEVIAMNKLNAAARERIRLEEAKAAVAEKWVKTAKGDLIKINEDDLKKPGALDFGKNLLQRGAGALGVGDIAGGILGKNPWMAAAAGVALVGKKLLDAYDLTNRLGAMSQQTTMHWARGDTHLSSIKRQVREISDGFKETLEVSAEYVKKLSEAGMSYDQTKNFAQELLARQTLTGQSLDSQLDVIREIKLEFGMSNLNASKFLGGLIDAQQSLEGQLLSIEQIKNDIFAMSENMKAFNGSALSAVGIYKTLMRDADTLRKTGLGAIADMAQSQRRELSLSVSRISTDMPTGWKAYYGGLLRGGKGRTPSENILAWERLTGAPGSKEEISGQFQQWRVMSGSWLRDTRGMSYADRVQAIRLRMEQDGVWSKSQIQQLSVKAAKGDFSEKFFKELIEQEKKLRPLTAEDNDKTTQDIVAAINNGKAVSSNMKTTMDKIHLWATNVAQGLMERMAGVNETSLSSLAGSDEFTAGQLIGKGIYSGASAVERASKEAEAAGTPVAGRAAPWDKLKSLNAEGVKEAQTLASMVITTRQGLGKLLAKKGFTTETSQFDILSRAALSPEEYDQFAMAVATFNRTEMRAYFKKIQEALSKQANIRQVIESKLQDVEVPTRSGGAGSTGNPSIILPKKS